MNCPYCPDGDFRTDDDEQLAKHIVDAHLFIVANSELHLTELAEHIIDMAYNIFLFGDEYLYPNT